ncbi:MAG: hypothetical protein AAB336_08340, partial [Acidobacteriota bacterium]
NPHHPKSNCHEIHCLKQHSPPMPENQFNSQCKTLSVRIPSAIYYEKQKPDMIFCPRVVRDAQNIRQISNRVSADAFPNFWVEIQIKTLPSSKYP